MFPHLLTLETQKEISSMELFICKHCGDSKKSKKSVIGHETFCKKNPDHKIQNTESARKKAAMKIKCKHCGKGYSTGNIVKHEKSCNRNSDNFKICPICSNTFTGRSLTCSHSCSNAHFRHSDIGGLKYKTDEELVTAGRYRDLCFRHHDKKCAVCEEENIVAVHHLNENHFDNRPENLIPLCPTHHQYLHSKYKHLINNLVEDYVLHWNNSR